MTEITVSRGRDRLCERRRGLLSALAAAPFLAACVGLPSIRETADRYALNPAQEFPADASRVDWQLVVGRPGASDALDSTRILYRESEFRLSHISDAAWATRLPDHLRALMVESFENSGRIDGVAADTAGFRGRYVLASDLRAFEAVSRGSGQAPRIHLSLSARLTALPDRRIVASRRFDQETAARAAGRDAVIAAFGAATQSLLRDLVVWTLVEGERDRRSRPINGA